MKRIFGTLKVKSCLIKLNFKKGEGSFSVGGKRCNVSFYLEKIEENKPIVFLSLKKNQIEI